jgi:hypothetical protein
MTKAAKGTRQEYAAVYKWFWYFKKGRHLLEDDPRKETPEVACNDEIFSCL